MNKLIRWKVVCPKETVHERCDGYGTYGADEEVSRVNYGVHDPQVKTWGRGQVYLIDILYVCMFEYHVKNKLFNMKY